MPAGVEPQFFGFPLLVSSSLEARGVKLEAGFRDEQVGAMSLFGVFARSLDGVCE